MKKFTNISSDPFQIFNVPLDDGTTLTLTLNYKAAIQRWQYNIVHPSLNINGKIICSLPNLLRTYRNKISFGLMCSIIDGTDPTFLDDFSSERAILYLLDNSDVAIIEDNLRSVL